MFKNEKGVTLVELLIVIVILGIIAAISVPAVGNIVSNANKDALLADATNLQQQVSLYCTSEDDPVICGENSAANDDEATYFENAGTKTLDAYVDGIGAETEYIVWYADDTWNVAIDDGEYYFAGDPSSASRDNVLDASTDVFDGFFDETETTDFPEPSS